MEFLDEIIDDNTEAFFVDDDSKAEWCLRKIREAEEEKARWKLHYQLQYESIERACDSTIETMQGLLREYFAQVPHKVAKTQESYRLPSGKLVLKHQEPEFEKDDGKIIAWLKQNGGSQFVKVKESLDWAELKKTLNVVGETVADENGQVMDGIRAVERPDVFKIEK